MVSKGNKKQDIPLASVNWLQQLAAEINVPFAPEGWYTMTQICTELNRDHNSVRILLKKRNAQTAQFRSYTTGGKMVVTTHYKL